jgi:hypothetical protein
MQSRFTRTPEGFNIRHVPQNYFVGWDDLAATYPQGNVNRRGLDHILCSTQVNARLAHQLGFRSDAYHYPVCGDVT